MLRVEVGIEIRILGYSIEVDCASEAELRGSVDYGNAGMMLGEVQRCNSEAYCFRPVIVRGCMQGKVKISDS
jgi:hypothetical protein